MLAWAASEPLRRNASVRKVGFAVKRVGLMVAAPFIALAYVLSFPFIGLGMLIYVGTKSIWQRENRK